MKKKVLEGQCKIPDSKEKKRVTDEICAFFSGWIVSGVKGKQSDSTGTIVQQNAAYLFGHGSMRA